VGQGLDDAQIGGDAGIGQREDAPGVIQHRALGIAALELRQVHQLIRGEARRGNEGCQQQSDQGSAECPHVAALPVTSGPQHRREARG
jgi:hypothetical protein